MKKMLFFMVIATAGQLYSDIEENIRRFDTVKPLLCALQMWHSKMELLCLSAIRAFGVEGLITTKQVLARLEGSSEQQNSLELIQFAGGDDFLSWISSQKNTILLVYDQGSLKSAICMEYVQYLSQQSDFTAHLCGVEYDHLTPILWDLQEMQNDTMRFTDIVPNAVFVIDGHLWQIPDDLAALDLKYWIDEYTKV